ncbi:response regulator transcription factor [Limibacter armeniacum]|uniref:response regulator transcription factor n=1 Tax=Limibacter armeniacum TaxID=466084 RepID=UPI002FE5B1A2
MIRIIIADDHQMFIDGLKSLLIDEPDIQVVGEAHNGQEVLDLLDKVEANFIIMDISMPDMDGIQATEAVLKKKPDIKVLGLSMHNDKDFISNMLKVGAQGYILKNTGKKELVNAVKTIWEGENYLSKEVSQTLLTSFMKKPKEKDEVEKLSKREMEILTNIAEGLTTQDIADKLFISKNTVETHRKNLLFKLKAKNTAELVNVAFRKGIIK